MFYPIFFLQKTEQFGSLLPYNLLYNGCSPLTHACIFDKTLPGGSQGLQSTVPVANIQQCRIIASKLSPVSAFALLLTLFLPWFMSTHHWICFSGKVRKYNLQKCISGSFWIFPKQVLVIIMQGWDHAADWCSNFPLVVPEHRANSLFGHFSLQFAHPNFHPVLTAVFLTI